MSEVHVRLTPEALGAYQLAVRDRMAALPPSRWFEARAVRWIGAVLVSGLAVMIADLILSPVLQRPIEYPEFLAGLSAGIAILSGIVWVASADLNRRVARPDGPILSPQTIRVASNGLFITSQACNVRYPWTAVQSIAETRGLVILWVEPGAGIAIPADAFESDAARAQFIGEAQAFRAVSAVG